MRSIKLFIHNKGLILYAFLYGGSAAFLKLVGFGTFLYFAKILTTPEYAEFGLMYSLQTAIVTFSMAGIVEYVIAHMHINTSDLHRQNLFKVANSLLFIFTAIIIISVICYFVFFNKNITPDSSLLLVAVVFNGICLTYSMFKAQLVRLTENHSTSLLYNFVIPFIGMISGLGTFLVYFSVISFFIGSLFGLLLPILIIQFRQRLEFSLDWKNIKRALISCTPFIGMAFFNWLSGYGNNQLIDIFFEEKEVAIFTFLYSVSAVMQLVATALNQVWAPKFYRITHTNDFAEVELGNKRFFKFMSLVLGSVGAILILSLPMLSQFIGGNAVEYGNNQFLLMFLLAGYVILAPWWHCQNYFLAYNKGGELFNLTIVSTIIGISISLGLMAFIGAVGVYVGFFAVMVFRVLFIIFKSKRYWRLNISWGGLVGGLSILASSYILLNLY